MFQEKGKHLINTVIGDWRVSHFDPMVGESVFLELQILASGSRSAAEGVEVLFKAPEHTSPVRVLTNGGGWARFAYKAEQAGDIEVIATLDTESDEVREAPSHTFRIKALAAEIWDDARIQLNAEPDSSVWGSNTLFPRTTVSHTVKLAVTRMNSHLIGREISLGLASYSSPVELGISRVEPALGIARPLTEEGLTWTFTHTAVDAGGAYALALRASRLLKQSPVNRMSLGETALPALSEGDGQVVSSAGDTVTV